MGHRETERIKCRIRIALCAFVHILQLRSLSIVTTITSQRPAKTSEGKQVITKKVDPASVLHKLKKANKLILQATS